MICCFRAVQECLRVTKLLQDFGRDLIMSVLVPTLGV